MTVKPRAWLLSIFDHTGSNFILLNDKLIAAKYKKLAWVTPYELYFMLTI